MSARGGGLWRAPDRRLQHDPRDQGGVDRARPRPARVRAVRLRRQRPAVRRRHGARARHQPGDRAAARRACSRPSGCSTPTSSTTTRAPSAACCGSADLGRDRARLGRAGAAGDGPARGRRASTAQARACAARRRCTTRARASNSSCRCPTGRIDAAMVAHLEEAFGAEHETHLRPPRRPGGAGRAGLDPGRRPGRCARARQFPSGVVPSRSETEPGPPRRAYFGAEHGWIETPVLDAPIWQRGGPARSSSRSTTPPASFPPGATAELDPAGNIVIELA